MQTSCWWITGSYSLGSDT